MLSIFIVYWPFVFLFCSISTNILLIYYWVDYFLVFGCENSLCILDAKKISKKDESTFLIYICKIISFSLCFTSLISFSSHLKEQKVCLMKSSLSFVKILNLFYLKTIVYSQSYIDCPLDFVLIFWFNFCI